MSYGYTEVKTKDGRLALVGERRRIAHTTRSFGYYNAVSVIWINEDRRQLSRESLPLGKFNREYKPKATGYQRVFDAGTQRFV